MPLTGFWKVTTTDTLSYFRVDHMEMEIQFKLCGFWPDNEVQPQLLEITFGIKLQNFNSIYISRWKQLCRKIVLKINERGNMYTNVYVCILLCINCILIYKLQTKYNSVSKSKTSWSLSILVKIIKWISRYNHMYKSLQNNMIPTVCLSLVTHCV